MPWDGYVDRFHAERPGITERILSRCRADEVDPYTWCVAPLTTRPGLVVDLACGSAPTADHLPVWVGLDRSAAELGAARAAGRGPLLRASAKQLPVATGATLAAVCAMGLQVVEPLGASLAEAARVLRPGGRLSAIVPANGPLPWRDALLYLRLQVALRCRIRYPNDASLGPTRLAQVAAKAGLSVEHDEPRAFSLPLDRATDVDDLLQSLYLPDVPVERLQSARRLLAGRIGGSITIPLRRVILVRAG